MLVIIELAVQGARGRHKVMPAFQIQLGIFSSSQEAYVNGFK